MVKLNSLEKKEERQLNPKNKYKGMGARRPPAPCDDPTLIIDVSSSDSSISSSGAPFVNVKRKPRTPVVTCGKPRLAKELFEKDRASSNTMPSQPRKRPRRKWKEAKPMCRAQSNKGKGVRRRRDGNWAAEIWEPCMQSMMKLGTFSSEMEAALAYDEAAIAMYGSCARLNFPDYNPSPHSPSCVVISSSDSSIAVVHPNNVKPNDKDGEQVEVESKKEEVSAPEEASCDEICLLGEMFKIDQVLDGLGPPLPDVLDGLDFLKGEEDDEQTMIDDLVDDFF